MTFETRPFSFRHGKPYRLLICPKSGRTAVFGVDGDIMANSASDELLLFAIENFVQASWFVSQLASDSVISRRRT